MTSIAKNTLFALVTTTSAVAGATEWEIDATHANAAFAVRHMMVSTVRGGFSGIAGTVVIDDKDISHSKVDVTIDAASLDSKNAKRDEHLKSPDFFDVAHYPKISFRSTKVEKLDGGKLKVTGDLTIRNVTKSVALLVDAVPVAQKNPWGKLVRGVSATATLNRKDFGLTWNMALESGGVLVGDEVQLTLDAELAEKAVPATN